MFFLWLNVDLTLGGSAASRLPRTDTWRRHSLSHVHNKLWTGDSAYMFDADVNNSQVFETQGYTTLIRLGPLEALVAYNRCYHPGDGVPGCYIDGAGGQQHEVCRTAFVMRLTLARKFDDTPACMFYVSPRGSDADSGRDAQHPLQQSSTPATWFARFDRVKNSSGAGSI
eukprot:SAG11_NODE_1413_length_4981_cov_2.208726_3_plen_170_part_00